MQPISLDKLHDDPRNANVCSDEVLAKIERHIQRTGVCPALLVRPHPNHEEHFILIDGHHRKKVLIKLGRSDVECQVINVDEQEAGVLLLTLNRLRGTDIPRKRAELIHSLLPVMPLEELSQLLPETKGEIDGLLSLLQLNEEAQEAALREQIAKEAQSLPVPFGFMIPASDVPQVEQALTHFQAQLSVERAGALVAICREVMKHA